MSVLLEKEVILSLSQSSPDRSVIHDLVEIGGNKLMQRYISESESRGVEHNLVGILCAVKMEEISSEKDENEALDRIKKFVLKIKFNERDNLFSLLRKYKEFGLFQNSVLRKLREPILNRYKDWEPEIKNQYYKLARKKAMKEAEESVTAGFLTLTWGSVGLFFWFILINDILPLIANFLISVGVSAETLETIVPSGFMNLVIGLAVLFIPPIACGIIIGWLARKLIMNNKVYQHMRVVEEKEKVIMGLFELGW